MKAQVFCQCGGEMEVEAPWPVAESAMKAFWQVHVGPGHGDTSAARARRARRIEEEREARRAHP